jgi:predicted ArsR family transcriptional regulator/TusA-related sulfurtransferase
VVQVASASGDTSASADDAAIEAVLEVPTRAGIYRRLRLEGQPLSARDVAAMFGLHANVARTHLDALAEVGLVLVGSRKHPGGGRPARVYVAREQVAGPDPQVPPGGQLAVHAVVQLIAGLAEHRAKLAILAEEQGRKLVSAVAGRAAARDLDAAAVVAVEALKAAFPEVRLAGVADEQVVIEGFDAGLRLIGEVDGQVGDALTIGFVRGALAAAGAPARVTARAGRAVAVLDADTVGVAPAPAGSVDVRRLLSDAGVRTAMRAMEGLAPGDHLEVLTDVEGSPAAYARWADRAGHEVVDVARVRDPRGRRAVRVLLRKATGR